MKARIITCIHLSFIVFISACGQHTHAVQDAGKTATNQLMLTEKITNPTVKKAIDALQSGNGETWFSLFSDQAELFDDGHKKNFKPFFQKAIGHERFISIDKVKNDGLTLFGEFHSDLWGDFKTYFKFQIGSDGKIDRLEIGQANY